MSRFAAARRLGFGAVLVALVLLVPAPAAPSPGAPSPRVLVVVRWPESGAGFGRVTIVSLAGKQYPAPMRVRAAPLGVSPDGHSVAEVRNDSVLVGRVRGGAMRTVIRGTCPKNQSPDAISCPGADAAYVWSSDSRRLAVSASPAHGPTQLAVADSNGRIRFSLTLPARNRNAPRAVGQPASAVYHQVLSWSPDGARLLLEQSDVHGFPTAAVIVELGTRKTRTLALFVPCDSPQLTWSPDGRFIALKTAGTQDCRDRFEVFDVRTGRAIIRRSWVNGAGRGGTVWAPDSRSVFGTVFSGRSGSRIDRYDLAGARSTVLTARTRVEVFVALRTGLVYERANALYRYDFSSRRSNLLDTGAIKDVLPLIGLP